MLIILNHKMNLTIDEIKKYEIKLRDYNVVVMPQTPYMGLFSDGKYTLGSQCISEYNATGGVSADALVGLNVKYVLVGHGERRYIERDTNEVILKKTEELIKHNINPVLCIGETLEEKNNGKLNEVLKKQIDVVFEYVNNSNIIIAYEPLWLIGKEKEIDIKDISDIVQFIKNYMNDRYNVNIKVLYGGGINNDNAKKLKDIKILDGVVIGTASLDIDNIIKIYNTLK